MPASPSMLWQKAGWPARLLFLAFAGLFTFRALHLVPLSTDCVGFFRMGGAVLDGGLDRDPLINTYPPTFQVAMAPLAMLARALGVEAARHLWTLAQLGALVTFTAWSARALQLRLSLGAVAIAWACVWRPIVIDINNQNVSLLLFALISAALAQAGKGAEGRAGALLGLGAALKVWPGAALLGLLAARPPGWRRLAVGFVAAVLGAVAVTVLAMGPARVAEALRFWLLVIPRGSGGNGVLNQSWTGVLQRLLGGVPLEELTSAVSAPPMTPALARARTLALVVGAVVPGAVLLSAVRSRAPSPRVRALDGLLVTFAALPSFPLGWAHYFIVGLPVVLAVVCGAAELPRLPRRSAVWLLSVGAVLLSLFDSDVVGARVWKVAAFYGNALGGALLMLAAGLVVRGAWARADAARA